MAPIIERSVASTQSFHVIVPARYASSRLPGKPLADIAGKPMIVHVLERAAASGAAEVWAAVDHPEVASAVRAHGFRAVMTSPTCACGTDRLAEAAVRLGWPENAVIVNVQGDEPLIDPALIRQTAACLHQHPEAAMATAAHPLHDPAQMFNPNVVKVVLDSAGRALYFSRAPIPWARDAWAANAAHSAPASLPQGLPVYRHIGLYAYRAGFLRRYPRLDAPAIEAFEALEQLRALWHGERIAVWVSDAPAMPGVDTPADLEAVRRHPAFASDL